MPQLTSPVPLSPHLYILYSEFPHVDSGNVYLITGRYPTLIDCGSRRALPQVLSNLSQLGLTPADLHQVLATHGDYDHVQGFHGLRELNPALSLHIHRRDWPIIQLENPYSNASYLYGGHFVRFAVEHCLPLEDGDVFAAGDTNLSVHHAPGHTEGSVCFLGEIDEMQILFAGDVIGGSMRGLDGAALEVWAQAVVTWEQSLRRLLTHEFAWVLNGHEPAHSLPLPKSRIERMLPWFGKMLNPWFFREDDDTTLAGAP